MIAIILTTLAMCIAGLATIVLLRHSMDRETKRQIDESISPEWVAKYGGIER
jgi:hypothetical protein